MAKEANMSLDGGPMLKQLKGALGKGRVYNGTSQKAERRGVPGKTNSPHAGQKLKQSSSWNPEKSPSPKTGINTGFEEYAPRGYYPPRKGETRVLEQVDYPLNIPAQKLKEK